MVEGFFSLFLVCLRQHKVKCITKSLISNITVLISDFECVFIYSSCMLSVYTEPFGTEAGTIKYNVFSHFILTRIRAFR